MLQILCVGHQALRNMGQERRVGERYKRGNFEASYTQLKAWLLATRKASAINRADLSLNNITSEQDHETSSPHYRYPRSDYVDNDFSCRSQSRRGS